MKPHSLPFSEHLARLLALFCQSGSSAISWLDRCRKSIVLDHALQHRRSQTPAASRSGHWSLWSGGAGCLWLLIRTSRILPIHDGLFPGRGSEAHQYKPCFPPRVQSSVTRPFHLLPALDSKPFLRNSTFLEGEESPPCCFLRNASRWTPASLHTGERPWVRSRTQLLRFPACQIPSRSPQARREAHSLCLLLLDSQR